MAALNHNKLNVFQLREYLKERGISTTNKSRLTLFRLAEAADEIDIEKIEADETYSESSVDRRTVEGGGILPDVFSIQEDKWMKNLKLLPNIEFGDIFIYLSIICQWDSDRIRKYKDDNSYKLFMQNHIDNVCYFDHGMCEGYIYVKATCVPETRQNERPYDCWVLLEKKGSVKSGGCTCVAFYCSFKLSYCMFIVPVYAATSLVQDDGGCKHCVALLFAVHAFCERHRDRGSETGTYIRCVLDRPRQSSVPVVIKDLSYRKKGHKCDEFNPLSLNEAKLSKDDVIKRLYKVGKKHGSVLTHTVEISDCDIDEGIVDHTNSCPSLSVMLHEIIETKPDASDDCILQHLTERHTDDYVNKVQDLTCTSNEDNQDFWYEQRKGRITASIMGSVTRCRMDKLPNDNYISREILGLSQKISLPSTNYGETMEKVALSQYTALYEKNHHKSKFSSCGLFVSQRCSCCGKGLIEIKCSFSYQHLTPTEVATQHTNYNLYLEGNDVKLKSDTKWYKQIQTQLGVTELQWCDFVFFTRKGISIDRIAFNPEYFEKCVQSAKSFFFKFLKSKLQ